MISPDDKRLLLCTVADPDVRRELTAYWSDGETDWQPQTVIHQGPPGYCDLQASGGDRIGMLYEAGETDYREQIRFKACSPEELL